MAEPVGVLAVAAVGRPAAWLDVGALPRGRAKRAEHCRGVESPRAHLHVVGLKDYAPVRAPIAMERQDQVLEAQALVGGPRLHGLALAHARNAGKWTLSLGALHRGCRRKRED